MTKAEIIKQTDEVAKFTLDGTEYNAAFELAGAAVTNIISLITAASPMAVSECWPGIEAAIKSLQALASLIKQRTSSRWAALMIANFKLSIA